MPILLIRNAKLISYLRSPILYMAKAGCGPFSSAAKFRALLTISSLLYDVRLFTGAYIDLTQDNVNFLF